MADVLLTFEDLEAGDIVGGQYVSSGVTISSTSCHAPMIFDSANPTGGDWDLATDNLGNVLILSEDNDSTDPDDNAGGGTFVFTFDEPSTVNNFTVLDTEEGGYVKLYDENDHLISKIYIPRTCNNGQEPMEICTDGVARMEVTLCGSGAIDNISFATPCTDGDGVVDGSSGDDLIDIAYAGDPHGDMIDNADAILPGETGDDDIVDALGGDDTIWSGEGNDEVYAGSGADEVHGGAGADVIYGDSNYDGDTACGSDREVLEWDKAPNFGDNADASGFTQNTGSVDVTFSVITETGAAVSQFETDTQYTAGIESDGAPVDAHSSFYSETKGAGNDGNYALDFSQPVENVSFRVNDIDGDGVVTIKAYDADGNPIEVTLTGGSNLSMLDTDTVAGVDTASSEGGYQPDTSPDYSMLVEINGPVARIEILHHQNGSDNSGVNVTDVYFDAAPVDDGQPGDDVIYGDAGDDIIYGEGGNDTLFGGLDNDQIYGGDGNDTITGGPGQDILYGDADRDVFLGGNAGDQVFGGATGDDWDTLDLTGAAPAGGSLNVTYTGPDSDGNGHDGYVTFYDNGGAATGTLTFENIEDVIPCFTPGSRIATPTGARLVEDLKPGDKVITRDNGVQEIRWAGNRLLGGRELAKANHLKPIMIKAGALGNGLPIRDMFVSPNHRMLVANDRTALYFEEHEVLVAAKHLVNNRDIQVINPISTTYIHFMFDQHEVVLADGAWTESFQPGDYTLKGMGNSQRNEIFEIFPDLQSDDGLQDYTAARKTLKKHEALLLKHFF